LWIWLEFLVMELRQLEYFVTVAQEANFTRAAQRLHISQSGVSAQVRQLERELGQVLLDRSSRSVRLTEVGQAVLPYARAALDAMQSVRLTVDELAGLVRGHVTVGMVSGCALPILAELLAGYHDSYPDVGIALTEGGSDRLVELLREGRLDLALIGSAGAAPPGLEAAVVLDEPLVAAVSITSPLAARESVTVDGLRELPLVSLPRGTGVRAALDAACAAAGFESRVVLEASALPMVAQLAARGLGVAVLPASAARSGYPELHVLQIGHPQPRSRLELAWNGATSTNPAARVLVEHARSCVRRLAAKSQPAA
jgi:DNA-binding transcriptional LysR family regulator